MENYLITRWGRTSWAQPSRPSLRSPSSSSSLSAHKTWKGCALVPLGKSAKAYYNVQQCWFLLFFLLLINWIVDEKKRCVCWGKNSITVKSSIFKYTSSLVGVINAFIIKMKTFSMIYFSLINLVNPNMILTSFPD